MKHLLMVTGLFFVLGYAVPSNLLSQTYFHSSSVNEIDTLLKKIMILHLGEDLDIRKTVEGEITYWLNKYHFNAAPSYRYFNSNRIPTWENINEILKENDFDGILTTTFVSIESKERFENTQSAYNLTPNSPTFYNFLDSYKNKYNVGYTVLEKAFIVDTKLFSTKSEQNLFQASTETYQPQSMDIAVEDFSKSIAKHLKKSKLLERTK
jgi:hypothetical protein